MYLVLGGALSPDGVYLVLGVSGLGLVSGPGGVYGPGGCLVLGAVSGRRGVSGPRGVWSRGVASQHVLRETPPHEQNDKLE